MSDKYLREYLRILTQEHEEFEKIIREILCTCFGIRMPVFFGGEKKKTMNELARAAALAIRAAHILDWFRNEEESGRVTKEMVDDLVELLDQISKRVPLFEGFYIGLLGSFAEAQIAHTEERHYVFKGLMEEWLPLAVSQISILEARSPEPSSDYRLCCVALMEYYVHVSVPLGFMA